MTVYGKWKFSAAAEGLKTEIMVALLIGGIQKYLKTVKIFLGQKSDRNFLFVFFKARNRRIIIKPYITSRPKSQNL